MRYSFILLNLSLNLLGCFAIDDYWHPKNGYGETYVGNPDRFSKIVRPCPVYDLNCIRKFFSSHAHCEESRGPLPDSFVRSQFDSYLSRINITASHTNTVIDGFNNTRIEEFYLNYATNQVVFTIEARNLSLFTLNSYLQFYRRGLEPIVINTTTSIFYRSLSITAIIPNIDKLEFDKMEVTAFLPDPISPFTIGSEVFTNPDPTVQQALAELFMNIPSNIQEVLLTDSPVYPPAYIQYNICDFGYDPVRKNYYTY